MDNYTLARVIHILSIVIWIGGVAMVTAVILPAVRAMKSEQNRLESFEEIEGRFSRIAKITTLLTGLSGFYMLYITGTWERYLDLKFWWLHAMTLVWLIFTVILFILEPFVLKKLLDKYVKRDADLAFRIIYRAHWILLIVSLITIAGAVAGSHGWFFFG